MEVHVKLKEGLLLREIAGQWIVVPIGERVVEMSGIVSLTETGALIWKELEKNASIDDIVTKIVSEYAVEPEEARANALSFIESIVEKGLTE